jgi:hypothetical protein
VARCRVIARVLSIKKHERAKGVTLLLSKALDVLFFFIFLIQIFFSLSIYPFLTTVNNFGSFSCSFKVVVKGLKDNLNRKKCWKEKQG